MGGVAGKKGFGAVGEGGQHLLATQQHSYKVLLAEDNQTSQLAIKVRRCRLTSD